MMIGSTRPFDESDIIYQGEYPTPGSQAAAASRATMVDYLPIPLTISAARTAAADLFGTPIDKDKARRVYEQFGVSPSEDDLTGSLTSEGTMRRARIMRDEAYRATQISRARQSTALTTRMLLEGFGVQFLDPMNYIVGGLSLTAAPAFVAGVTTKGMTAKRAAQAAVRLNAAKAATATTAQAFGRGAIEGLAGNALLEIPTYPLANYVGYDYTLTDSLLGIAVGAPFGGIIHAAPKAFRAARGKINVGKLKALAEDGMPDDLRDKVMADVADDELMDMAPIAARSVRDADDEFGQLLAEAEDAGINIEGVTTPVAKAAEVVDPFISQATALKSELGIAAERTAKPVTQKTEIKNMIGREAESLSQYVRRTGGIEDYSGELTARGLMKFGKGSGLVKTPKGDKSPELLAGARDIENPAAIDNVKQRVFDAGYFPEKNDYNEISDSELWDAIVKDANEPDLRKRIYDRDAREKLAAALESDSGRMLDEYDRIGINKDMPVEDIASRLREISEEQRQGNNIRDGLSGVINAADDAAEMIQSVSPQTRVAAQAIATKQMLDGNPVDIEHILAMDAKSGKPRPTGGDVASAMDTHIDEDALRFYDDDMDIGRREEAREAALMQAEEAEAKRIDSEREAEAVKPPPTVAEVETAVRKSFGRHTQKVMDAAKLKVVQSVDDIHKASALPKLPKELAGAKPRYGKLILHFESDIEKSIYIVGGLKIDRNTGQLKRSKSHDAYAKFLSANGISEKQAREMIDGVKQKIKNTAKDADEENNLIVKSGDGELYSKAWGDVKGVRMPDGTVYLVADNIDPSMNVQGLVLHEMGVHVGLRNMVGDVEFKRILDDVMVSDRPLVRQARERVPEDTPPQHIAEETLAYLVEYAPHDDFVGNLIGAIKAWLMRNFKMKFSVDEFTARHLAIGALRRESKLGDVGGDTMFSKNWVAPKHYADEIQRGYNNNWVSVKKIDDEHSLYREPIIGKDYYIAKTINPDVSIGRLSVGKDGVEHFAVIEPQRDKGYGRALLEAAKADGKKINEAELRTEDYVGVLQRVEKTSAGEQAVIPGAERISDKQLAERKMEQPLQAKKPQKRMDEGLFAEPDRQMVMFSRAKKPERAERPKLADELRIFDDALKEAENYEPALRAALDNFGDSAAMRKQLSQNGVSNEMLDYVLDTIAESHKRVRATIAKKKKAAKGEEMLSQLSSDAELMAKQMAESIKEKINLDKLNAMRGFIAREKAYQRFQRFGAGFAYEAISSIMTGSSMLRQGARDNISSLHKSYVRGWVGSLEAAMKRDGVWEMFVKDVHERDVAKALERMDDDKPDFSGINKDAVKIAKAVYRVREHARMTQNSFGANIRQFRNYITRQSHDQIKVHNAGFDEWYAYILPRLNLSAMELNINSAKDALKEVYNQVASGNYEVDLPTDTSIVDYRKGANVAKRVSASRELIFKRDMWFDYNQKFGTNTLKASLVKSLDKAGRDAALMRMLGPNPQDNLDRVIQQVNNELSRQDVGAATRFNRNKQDALRSQLMVVDGRSNIAGNVLWAKINSNVRSWQVMAKLGGAVFSSMPDIAIYARNFSRFEGRGNIFQGMAEAVRGLLTNHSAGESKEILEALGIVFENTIADMTHTLNKNGTFTDNMSAMTRIFTKLNVQVPWTTQLQKSASIGLSNHLAKSAGKSFDNLSDELKNVFKIHGIDGAKWDVIRKAVGEADDGRMYLDTHALSRMDDATMTKYIESLGRKATPVSIEKAREAITADLRAMFIDRAESAVLSSDARTQAAVLRGTSRGEFTGEFLRYVMQFKSFPMMMYERVLKREVYGLGYDSLADYWARGKGDMVGFANFLATMTAMGYLSMTIKDALAQREPRPLDRAGTWIEAMRRGGAMGLYGDFLLQEYDRHAGAGLAEAIMGPAVGAAGDVAEIVTAALNGDKFATKALRTIQSNTPGANLFYVKPAIDNLIMWNLYESASPGFLKRMQRNVQERTGQQFFLPPSATALR